MKSKTVLLAAIILFVCMFSACGTVNKTKDILHPTLSSAKLINIPLNADTFSFTFQSWIDNENILVTRNNQPGGQGLTNEDYFIYNIKTNNYKQVEFPDKNNQSLHLAAVLKSKKLIFETEPVYSENSNNSYHIDVAWLYDISTNSTKKYDLTSQVDQVFNGEMIFSSYISSHAYYINDDQLFIRYIDPHSSDYAKSPDGSKLAYFDQKGLNVANIGFNDSKLILPNKTGKDINGTDTEAPRYPIWLDNNRIAYRWVGYEWLICSGIINSDGSGNEMPEVLKQKYLQPLKTNNKLLSYGSIFEKPFLGIYDSKKNTMTDFSTDIDLKDQNNTLFTPDGRIIIILGQTENDITLIKISDDLSRVEQSKKPSGMKFNTLGSNSRFSPDNKSIIFDSSYDGNDYMLYVSLIDKLFK